MGQGLRAVKLGFVHVALVPVPFTQSWVPADVPGGATRMATATVGIVGRTIDDLFATPFVIHPRVPSAGESHVIGYETTLWRLPNIPSYHFTGETPIGICKTQRAAPIAGCGGVVAFF